MKKRSLSIHAADVARTTSDLNLLKTAPVEASSTDPVLQRAPPQTLTPNRLANGMPKLSCDTAWVLCQSSLENTYIYS